MGLGTALLPCGWIVSFGLLSAATGSATQGALLFVVLWAGSLPALIVGSMGFTLARERVRSPIFRRDMAIGIVLIALVAVSHRWSSSHGGSGGAAFGNLWSDGERWRPEMNDGQIPTEPRKSAFHQSLKYSNELGFKFSRA